MKPVVVCKLAYCHAGPGCPICEDIPCECPRCAAARAPEAKAEGPVLAEKCACVTQPDGTVAPCFAHSQSETP